MNQTGWLPRLISQFHNTSRKPIYGTAVFWEQQCELSILAVGSACSLTTDQRWSNESWFATARRTFFQVIQSNLSISIAADMNEYCWDWPLQWSPPLCEEFIESPTEMQCGIWDRSFSVATDCLLNHEGPHVHNFTSAIFEQAEGTEPSMEIETALTALAVVTSLISGSLLAVQLKRPSDEFRRIRELAKKYPWARRLSRRGPRFADRTIWSLKDAWSEDVFAGDSASLSSACDILASETKCDLIKPSLGHPFDDKQMRRSDTGGQDWVMATESLGLAIGGDVIQRAVVTTTSSDRIGLLLTQDHRLSESCLRIMENGEPSTLIALDADLVESVRNAARSLDEFDQWQRLMVENSPAKDLVAFNPRVGDQLNQNTMLYDSELLFPGTAVVSRVVCPGMQRGEKVLFPAHVDAVDGE